MSRPLADPVFDIGKDLQRAYEEGYRQGRLDEKVETEMSLPKWIPVGERLPKINTPVMLCGKYNEVIGYRRSDSDWMALSGDGWETDIEDPEDFIAWMSLPEPYKGGEDE